jgi:hypothetical protein
MLFKWYGISSSPLAGSIALFPYHHEVLPFILVLLVLSITPTITRQLHIANCREMSGP